ncbi:hypothetical protein [Flagellimonas onchidii]|uniref:hypothetical protein n=1 Tax=Flagellimonas onchidii TaxID=2562684 RepID=UPI0010A5EF6C|nr:hypothetical protein [Allomuricauda onchidii]
MRKYYFLLLIGCFLIFNNNLYSQWTKESGKGYYKLSAWYLEADEHYTSSGQIDPNATRGQFNINLYGEYGLNDRWDLVGYIPFFSRTYQNDILSRTTNEIIIPGEEVNSIGDIDLGLTYGLLQKENLAISVTLMLGIPSGDDAGGSDGSYQTGDGEFNQLLKVAAGVPFKITNTPLYVKAYVGYNNRTQNFSDELRGGAELGIQLFNSLWLASKLNIVESLQNGSLSAQNNQGSIFANNVEFTNFEVEAAYYITKKFGLSVNYATALSGRIIYAAPSYSGGIFMDIQ